MNERIKYLRKELLHLSMEEFGEGIHISKAAVSRAEAGLNGISDQTVDLICREYGVREEWLRDGTGDVFVKKSAEDELNALADKVMTDTPDSFRRRFVSMLAKLTDEQWQLLSDMEDMMLAERKTQSDQAASDQLHSDLDREIALQKKPEEKSTGSGSTRKSGTPENGTEESVG